MASAIDLTSTDGWRTLEAELPDNFEELAKEHKVLEVQYGPAKITSASDLLRLVLLHAGADLGLRQTVAVVAESGGPSVSHVTLHKKMRLSAPYLRALVARLAQGEVAAPRTAFLTCAAQVARYDGAGRGGSLAERTGASDVGKQGCRAAACGAVEVSTAEEVWEVPERARGAGDALRSEALSGRCDGGRDRRGARRPPGHGRQVDCWN
ncbi:MAG: hypothetical protein ACRDL7_06370 [Gaiellaceae bacterium]